MLGRIADRTGLLTRLRAAWKEDVRDAAEPLRRELRHLSKQVERLEASLKGASAGIARAERSASQTRLALRLNEQHRDDVAGLPAVLDEGRTVQHVCSAIEAAPLDLEPYPHAVIERLLPDDLYRWLLTSIPPAAFFGDRDLVKQNLRVPIEFGPVLSERLWRFVDEVIARRAIRPAVIDKFEGVLHGHYDNIFGVEFRDRAKALPQAVSGGRLMLRRPGYALAPHRDPKRSMITCLFYLARPGDSEVYGTEIYRVIGDRESGYAETYYPGEDGRQCELVKVVPYRPNTMLAFLNASGAHGARIADDAPSNLERYTFQFYVGPEGEALDALIDDLGPERKAMWRRKKNRGD